MSEQKKVRIGRLDTVGGVTTELGRVYRLARRGLLDFADAKALTYVLRELRCALEAGDVERRLDALEALEAVEPRGKRLSGRFGVQAPFTPAYHETH